MSTAANVTTAKPEVGGGVSVAPLGTAAPTDASTPLDSAYKSLGYISEDGMTNNNSPSSQDIKAWGGSVVASVTTERPDKFAFKLIEGLNVDVLKNVYGENNVTEEDGVIKIAANAKDLPLKSWVSDMILNEGTLKRIYLPTAKITEIGEIVYKDNEAVGYSVTVSAYPDSQGNTHYEFIE